MRAIGDDNYQELVRQLGLSSGRSMALDGDLAREIKHDLQQDGWNTAIKIVAGVRAKENIGRNLLGVIDSVRREIKIAEGKRVDKLQPTKGGWRAAKDCASPQEWRAMFKYCCQLARAVQEGLLRVNGSARDMQAYLDRYDDYWNQQNFGPAWCPEVTQFVHGYRQAYIEDEHRPGVLASWIGEQVEGLLAVRYPKGEQ